MELTIKGKTVTLTPLTPVQLFRHAEMLRDAVMIECKRQMVGLPLDVCKHAWDAGRAEARAIQLGNPAYIKATAACPALAHAIYLAAKPLVDGLTLDDAIALFVDPMTAAAVATYLLGITLPPPTAPAA